MTNPQIQKAISNRNKIKGSRQTRAFYFKILLNLIDEFPDSLFLHHYFNQPIVILWRTDHALGADNGSLGFGLVMFKDLQRTVFECLIDLFKALHVP